MRYERIKSFLNSVTPTLVFDVVTKKCLFSVGGVAQDVQTEFPSVEERCTRVFTYSLATFTWLPFYRDTVLTRIVCLCAWSIPSNALFLNRYSDVREIKLLSLSNHKFTDIAPQVYHTICDPSKVLKRKSGHPLFGK